MTAIWFIAFAIYGVCAYPLAKKAIRLEKQGKIEEKNELLRKMAQNVVRRLFRIANIKLSIEGYENIPKEGVILYAANHQSFLDIGIMILMREPCGFIVKKEAEKLPLIKTWMKVLGCVFVDRDNPRKAASALMTVCNRMNEGNSFVIFPEGTRSKDGKVGEFKGGAFKALEKTGATLVPVAIEGTYKAWEQEHKIKSAKIKVKILPAIETKDMTRKEIKALLPVVQKQVSNAVNSLK